MNKNHLITIIILFLLGCSNSKDFSADLTAHRYDEIVIQKLPLYDSLQQVILSNYDSLNLRKTNSNFTYLYKFDTLSKISGYSNTDVPMSIYPRVVQLFEKIGPENIFGFILSEDSTIEFLIRNTHLSEYFLDIRERLFWLPQLNDKRSTTFPEKDTILLNRWQYSIWYDKRSHLIYD